MKNYLLHFRLLFCLLLSGAISPVMAETVEKWEIAELSFQTNKVKSDPFLVQFGAFLIHKSGVSLRVPGFFNGNGEWLLRFCPDKTGDWSYTTFSSLPELAGKTGTITVTDNTRDWQRGPLKISPRNPQRFMYADGSPYVLMAFELDWLFALDAENTKGIPRTTQIVQKVRENGFNQIVMNVFAYDAGWGEKDRIQAENNFARPTVFPFGGSNETPDFSTLNVAYFQQLDRVIEHLNEKEMIAHLMIYVWNKKVNWPDAESAADNLYFDYVVKRYQAFPNLVWDISKEALGYGHDDMGYVTRRIDRLRQLDSHKRLLSVHDYNYCSAFPGKVDFISIQEWTPHLHPRMVDVAKEHSDKPVFNIEHGGYEKTDIAIFSGAYTDPLSCLDRNYQCLFAGTYSTYYWQNTAWYHVITDPDKLPENQRPHFRYYRHLTDFFSDQPYHDLTPVEAPFAPPMLTNGKDLFLYYLSQDRSGIYGELKQGKNKKVKIRWFDPLTGKSYDGGEIQLGDNGWLGSRRAKEISGPIAIAVAELQD